jgi:small-conductance mechanosensitive channel/CRP-like cAMP-binding protein
MLDRVWNEIVNGGSAPLLGGAFCIGIALALLLRRNVATSHRARLHAPIGLLIGSLLAWAALHFVVPGLARHDTATVVPALLALLAFGRLASVALFDWMLSRRLRRDAPRILRDICEGLIGVVALLVLLRAAGVEALPLLTTSALFTAILGLSLQDTLGNLLAGLVLQAQRPFDLGEWIQIDREGMQLGRVIELNWRATKVLTGEDQELNVPNSVLARSAILNLSRPSQHSRRSVDVTVPYEFPPERVRALLVRALLAVPGAVAESPAQVIAHGFVEQGIRYRVLFLAQDFAQGSRVDAAVRERIWYALQRAGIPFARSPGVSFGVGQVGVEALNLETRARSIRRVAFLRDLPDSAVHTLATDARTELYAPGEFVVRQGESGEELYLCVSGELHVLYTPEAGAPREMARIREGGLFGEFAHITGEARAASVQAVSACEVVVIGKTAFSAVLSANPDLAESISQRLAEQRAQLDEAQKLVPEDQRISVAEHKGRFLQRLRELLSL